MTTPTMAEVLAEPDAGDVEALRSAADACRRMADQAELDAGGNFERWDAFSEAEDWCLARADHLANGADQ